MMSSYNNNLNGDIKQDLVIFNKCDVSLWVQFNMGEDINIELLLIYCHWKLHNQITTNS